jgi:hypothetical protein
MKTGIGKLCCLVAVSLTSVIPSSTIDAAENSFQAWSVKTPTEGNHLLDPGLGIGNDFAVASPVTITALGVFDSNGDGIKGGAVLKVHLYASNPDRVRKYASGVLLETVLFDAANPGELMGSFRFKRLQRPVTLIPGQYTITAEGFDALNKDYRVLPQAKSKSAPVVLDDGRGLIRFTGSSHFHIGRFLHRTRVQKDEDAAERAPDRYGAASFTFVPAWQYVSPFANDYSTLTAGVGSFAWNTNKSRYFSYPYGSLSVLDGNAFPVIVEPSGNRLVFEAAGVHPSGGRCVAFADDQWGVSRMNDPKSKLFENAIRWASRKASGERVSIAISDTLDAPYFKGRGFEVATMDKDLNLDRSTGKGCDVLVIDFRTPYSEEFFALASHFVAAGGSVVIVSPPSRADHTADPKSLANANLILNQFGLAFRSSVAQLNDFGVTNIAAAPYPPSLFNAFPAAELLRKNRLGQVQLTSLEKVLALNTLAYASDGRPDLLSALSAVYSGTAHSSADVLSGGLGEFQDAVVLRGSQATTNRLGKWFEQNGSLISEEVRGSLEYSFDVTSPNIHRLQIFGSETPGSTNELGFPLVVSIDGIPLGQFSFQAPYGSGTLLSMFASKLGTESLGDGYRTSEKVECLTPYLLPGRHTVRVLWNNHNIWRTLNLREVRVQSATGQDSDADGMIDWVRAFINTQSGLDITNGEVVCHVSPACIEGRAAFPMLMDASVIGADKSAPNIVPTPAPNDRWFANVPLSATGDTTVHIQYQNGAKAEALRLKWIPINVLNGGSFTVRDGDSLLFNAIPAGATAAVDGKLQLKAGTNVFDVSTSAAVPYRFTGPAVETVTATYTGSDGTTHSGSVTVNVLRHTFGGDPIAHVGEERNWNVQLPDGVLLDMDQRVDVGQLLSGEQVTSLIIDQSEPRYFVSRLGPNGPILSSGKVQGFDFWTGKNTVLRRINQFEDGSELVEMMQILHPIPSDLAVQIDVFVGGVVFDDGTASRTITYSDFDALGQNFVRFIRPPTFKPAVCHSITLWQAGAVVGRIW